jgi:hypothetical protein
MGSQTGPDPRMATAREGRMAAHSPAVVRLVMTRRRWTTCTRPCCLRRKSSSRRTCTLPWRCRATRRTATVSFIVRCTMTTRRRMSTIRTCGCTRLVRSVLSSLCFRCFRRQLACFCIPLRRIILSTRSPTFSSLLSFLFFLPLPHDARRPSYALL